MMAITIKMEKEDIGMEVVDSAAPAPEADPAPSSETPSEVEETPADPTPEIPEVKNDEPILYETPDGRKVDAETLQKEWKENFLPEFTRKSQLLAEIEREKGINNAPKEPEWKNPDYIPQNYAEIIELAKREAINEIQNSYKAEQDRIKAIQEYVDLEISELKKVDPKLDENRLFQHANKYGFRDLKTAYKNMIDMKKAVVETEQRTVKNIKTREEDPIAGNAGGDANIDSGYDPKDLSKFNSASEYLSTLKGNK